MIFEVSFFVASSCYAQLESAWWEKRFVYQLERTFNLDTFKWCSSWSNHLFFALYCDRFLTALVDQLFHPVSKWRYDCKNPLILVSLSSNDRNGNETPPGKWWLFCDYCFFLASFIVDRARCKSTARSTVEADIGMKDYCCVFTLS